MFQTDVCRAFPFALSAPRARAVAAEHPSEPLL